mgnify:CR=1 FL=1
MPLQMNDPIPVYPDPFAEMNDLMRELETVPGNSARRALIEQRLLELKKRQPPPPPSMQALQLGAQGMQGAWPERPPA